jgi:prevent-host-death family protein
VKTLSMEEFRAQVDRFLEETARGDIIITREGKPWVVIRSVANDLNGDSARFADSAEFWQMIRERRQEKGIPWEEAEKLLDLD